GLGCADGTSLGQCGTEVSVSSRVEESLGDGPLDVQSLPIISGRPGSGILLLTEAPGAQHPHPSEAPNRSKPGIKT
ncbi:MAG: hypothetical protein ACI84E_001589, partial [Planctomycetota bacterium]